MIEFTIRVEKGKDGWLVSEVIELPGCHTQAKTLTELFKRTGEAICAYLEISAEQKDISIEAAHRLYELKSKKAKAVTEKDYKKFMKKVLRN